MECRFCGQWNPPESASCAFCRNPVDAAVDQTASGKQPVVEAAMPPTPKRRKGRASKLEQWLPEWARALAVGGVMAVLAIAAAFC